MYTAYLIVSCICVCVCVCVCVCLCLCVHSQSWLIHYFAPGRLKKLGALSLCINQLQGSLPADLCDAPLKDCRIGVMHRYARVRVVIGAGVGVGRGRSCGVAVGVGSGIGYRVRVRVRVRARVWGRACYCYIAWTFILYILYLGALVI